jgi:hypothetical protein
MLLTQRAAFADLQGYLGLTATELPNADGTALLLKAYHDLYVLFDKGDLYFDDTDTKKQAIQKEAEIYTGAYYYYIEWGPKKLLMDFETYETPLANDLSLGGVKIGEKGGSKQELLNWYVKQATICRRLAHKKMNLLLLGETKNTLTSNFG